MLILSYLILSIVNLIRGESYRLPRPATPHLVIHHAMSTAPPTLEHYKLETEFHEGYVVNRTYEWDYSVRREKSLQEWKRGRTLGKGGFGLVWLEEDKNTGELRAVKSLERNSAVLIDAGVTRELLALITLTAVRGSLRLSWKS